MPIDVYAPCLCGSGKKVKFCCNDIIDEMLKIISLRENNQLHMALQSLDALHGTMNSDHAGQLWVRATRARILMQDKQLDRAKENLQESLEAFPHDPHLSVLLALSSVSVLGYPASRDLTERVFQQSAEEYPEMVASLAGLLHRYFMAERKPMAARRHLSLACRLSDERQQFHQQLMELDADRSLPYWFRSDFFLRNSTVSDDMQGAIDAALDLADQGCWQLAAVEFAQLAQQAPDHPDLWYNTGLCRAWAGEDDGALEALRRAARSESDFDLAVEDETLAQLIDLVEPEEGVELCEVSLSVRSVAKLLTNFDAYDRLIRVQIDPDQLAESSREPSPSGIFQLLDRPELPYDPDHQPTIDQVPNVLADIVVFDAIPAEDQPAQAHVQWHGTGDLSEAVQLLLEVSAGEAEQVGEPTATQMVPIQFEIINWLWHFAEKTPLSVHRSLEKKKWHEVINETWPNTPLRELSGKTPLEAAGDAELKIALAASLETFMVLCDQQRYFFEAETLRERLQIPDPQPLDVEEKTDLALLPTPRLRRLALHQLSDEQLLTVLDRASVAIVESLRYDALNEVLGRDSLLENVELSGIYSSLSSICKNRFHNEEALLWVSKGRDYDRTRKKPLQEMVLWDIRELILRLEDPDDPQLQRLLKHLWDDFGPKLPTLRDLLTALLEKADVEPPWEHPVVQMAAAVGSHDPSPSNAVWTADDQPVAEKSKLWVPGQD